MPSGRVVAGAVVADVAVIVGVAADRGHGRVAASRSAGPSSVVLVGGGPLSSRRRVGGEQRSERQPVAGGAVARVRRGVRQPPHRPPAVVHGALESAQRVNLSSSCRRVIRRKRLSAYRKSLVDRINGSK